MSKNPAKQPGQVYSPLLPNEAVTLDAVAFDNLVHNQGVRFIHYRAIKCPVGLQDPHDVRRTHPDHSGCSNGFIHKAIGRVTAIFVGNQTEIRKLDAGIADGSTAVVTFPRYYDSDTEKRIIVRPYDRFYLEEDGVTTADWHITQRRLDALPDRLTFPATRVEHIIDSRGQWWGPESFDLVSGDIVWKDGDGPAPGTVYTAWFEYKPYWYVDRLVHEIRLIPVADYYDASKVSMERLSYGAVLMREYVHRDQRADDEAPASTRKQAVPEPEDDFGER